MILQLAIAHEKTWIPACRGMMFRATPAKVVERRQASYTLRSASENV